MKAKQGQKEGLNLGSSLWCRVAQRDGATWVDLGGNINEEVDLAPLKQLPGPLVLDLSMINRINSLGVRDWIDFVHDREAAGIDLVFDRCSPAMVTQISMISNFMGARSRVRSILVPYLCPACSHEHLEQLDVTRGVSVQPALGCPKCGAAMELDELMDTYSRLLTNA